MSMYECVSSVEYTVWRIGYESVLFGIGRVYGICVKYGICVENNMEYVWIIDVYVSERGWEGEGARWHTAHFVKAMLMQTIRAAKSSGNLLVSYIYKK